MTQATLSGDYAAAIQYLYGRINYELTANIPYRHHINLDSMRMLLQRLGNPQDQLPAVHIAGTKGKGSTAAMIGSVLQAAGYRTGIYTSPHLSCLEERYAIDGVRCTQRELVALTDQLRPVVDQMDRELSTSDARPLTFFELTTALAWLFFVQKAVDIVVLEVGLGGRLDSTNICQPLATVITSISFDHMRQLGNTLAAIAREKAGIIKTGIPVISGVTHPEAQQVIADVAQQQRAPLQVIGRDFQVTGVEARPADFEHVESVRFDYSRTHSPAMTWSSVELQLLGQHQAANAAVAIATLETLTQQGWNRLQEPAIRRGLAAATCPARVEIVRRCPTVVLDTSHNVASIAALLDTLRCHFPARPRTLLFAVSRDKDIRGMLHLALPEFDRVVLTQFLTNPRAMPADLLWQEAASILDSLGPGTRRPQLLACSSPAAAWEQLAPTLAPEELVCIAGSFFLAGELREVVKEALPVPG